MRDEVELQQQSVFSKVTVFFISYKLKCSLAREGLYDLLFLKVILTHFSATMFLKVCLVFGVRSCSFDAPAQCPKLHLRSKASLSLLCERRISGVTQRSISDISLMCFEKHTCILRKHSVRLELISLISLPTLLQTSKTVASPQRFHTVRNSAHYTASLEFPPRKTSRCICVVRVSLRSHVIVTVGLNVMGQVLQFGKRTKGTMGNLTSA